MHFARRLLLLLCAACIAGCSATQFAYQRLDFLARWELDKYVDMTPEQRTRFDVEFGLFWDWHRRSELPRYAATLRQIAARTDTPPDAAELARWSEQYGALWNDALEHLMPLFCSLGGSLSDAQVRSLLARADDDLADYAEDAVDGRETDLRDRAERSLNKSLRRWLGDLTPEQRQRLHEWNRTRPWIAPEWLAFRRSWRDALADTLAARQAPGFCPRLSSLVMGGDALWTETQRADFAANRERWLALFADLGPSLTPAQRQHLRKQLLGLAADLDALSTAPAANAAEGR